MPDETASTPTDTENTGPEVLIVTGMSGAGRSQAASVLEDLGWFVVDNLPPAMIDPLVTLTTKSGSAVDKLAVVVDVRGGQYFDQLSDSLAHMEKAGVPYRVLFLDASDEVLVRRFEFVRRPHPLQGDGGVLDGIGEERHILAPIDHRADVVIDTSHLSVHDLARQIRAAIAVDAHPERMRINIVAFGFKYGLPLDADMVVDMRFLANPYWVAELRGLTGHDQQVRDYVFSQPGAMEFTENYVAALDPVFKGFLKEEKRFTTLAVGCTGGKHRSVAMADELAKRLREQGHAVTVTGRDLGKE
jgi:UPF0042 nucleotide-binding protein